MSVSDVSNFLSEMSQNFVDIIHNAENVQLYQRLFVLKDLKLIQVDENDIHLKIRRVRRHLSSSHREELIWVDSDIRCDFNFWLPVI